MSNNRAVMLYSARPDILPNEAPRVGYVPEYNRSRNLVIAGHIASIIGGEVCVDDMATEEGAYYVPDTPLLRPVAASLQIRNEHDLFGGVVDVKLHHDKAILHPLVGKNAVCNSDYSKEFVKDTALAVLPGYTAFGVDDATEAFNKLQQQGYEVRCKDPSQDGGNGQDIVGSESQWQALIADSSPAKIASEGIVLEPNIADAATLSVGQISLGGNLFSYHGFQVQTTLPNGKPTYGGTTLTMVRGGFLALRDSLAHGPKRHAVEQSNTVYEAYSVYDPLLSRTNFDVVQGYAADGTFLSGVVDQSLRIGGASPAEILAIGELRDNPDLTEATAQVAISWDPSGEEVGRDDVVFFENSKRRDVARILSSA